MFSIHEHILAINAEQSARYIADEGARQRYWAKHTTFIACIKCMDGRVNFPVMTKTPVGIIKPFRAIGGKFDIWWPTFLGRVRHWTERGMANGSRNFIFVTYHYSASDTHLGCAGWKYDTAAARQHAEYLSHELGQVFGEQMTAIPCGIETDRDILTIHGVNGDISGVSAAGKSDADIKDMLRGLFPQMPDEIVKDIIPFLKGNAERVAELDRQPRGKNELTHNERVIGVGQGFDWLVQENLALVINDADPNLAESIRVAASLIEKNLKEAPAGDDATIFTNIQFRNPGTDERQATARSKGLNQFAQNVIRESFSDLYASGRVHTLTCVMWEPNKQIKIIKSDS